MRLEELINLSILKSYISEMGARLAMVKARDVAHDLADTEAGKKGVSSMFNVSRIQLISATLKSEG